MIKTNTKSKVANAITKKLKKKDDDDVENNKEVNDI
jgi:hypothetical protein